MVALIGEFWRVVRSPSSVLSLGLLTLGGFACGAVFWGSFNTAMEFTNTELFCVSCHEMRSNVYQEPSQTVHSSNRSGVRAICSDCHVPHDWTDKIARKMQASKEVWGTCLASSARARNLWITGWSWRSTKLALPCSTA